jgi:hypothetical protein
VDYGVQVLGHPLIAEAIETFFVPTIVRNNSKGDVHDAIRQRFGEASWNNPAVRIVDGENKLIVPRLYGDWSARATLKTLIAAMKKRAIAVPSWLAAFEAELDSARRGWSTAVFGMT